MTNPKTVSLAGVDCQEYVGPYENWHFNDGKPYSFPAIHQGNDTFLTALAELPIENGASAAATNSSSTSAAGNLETRLPPMWSKDGFEPRFIPFVFENKQPNGGAAATPTNSAYFRTNFPVNPRAWVPTYKPNKVSKQWSANSKIAKAKKRVVIVGVIDDGIPFANRSLLDSKGKTRMEFCWLQSADAVKSCKQVPFGREIANGEIDKLITKYGADEDLIYENAGATAADMPELGLNIRLQSTHGAHILSSAAGNIIGSQSDILADEIRIIAVQLPNTIAWDTSGFSKDMYMLSAVHYILERAKHLAKHYAIDEELPLVINFSYGWSGGRHDGEGYLESAVGELIQARRELAPSAMVIPSGNVFANNMHGVIRSDFFVENSFDFGWQLPPTDRTSSYLEVWLPDDYEPDNLEVRLTSPQNGDKTVTTINLTADPDLKGFDPRQYKQIMRNGQAIGQMSVDKHRNSKWRILIALAPTEPLANGVAYAPSGLWNVELKFTGTQELADKVINCWVQRDDDPALLNTGGQQSYLVDLYNQPVNKNPLAEPSVGDGFIQQFGSLSGIANHSTTTVVAGYDGFSKKPTAYSSAGMLLKNSKDEFYSLSKQVDCAAISNRSPTLPGVMASGVKSGSRSRLIGTSAAAPQVSREMAKAFLTLKPTDIKKAEDRNYVDILPEQFKQNHCGSTECVARLGGKKQ